MLTPSNMKTMASGTKPVHFPMALNKTTEKMPKARPIFAMSFWF